MSSVVQPKYHSHAAAYVASVDPEFDEVDLTDVRHAIEKHGYVDCPELVPGKFEDESKPYHPSDYFVRKPYKGRDWSMVELAARYRKRYGRPHWSERVEEPVPRTRPELEIQPAGPWKPVELPDKLYHRGTGHVLEWVRGTQLYANPFGVYYYVEPQKDGSYNLFNSDGSKVQD